MTVYSDSCPQVETECDLLPSSFACLSWSWVYPHSFRHRVHQSVEAVCASDFSRLGLSCLAKKGTWLQMLATSWPAAKAIHTVHAGDGTKVTRIGRARVGRAYSHRHCVASVDNCDYCASTG
jgi:hypothetical protein